jgi:hypothetical protein
MYEGVHESVGEGVHEGLKLRLSREMVKIYEYELCSVAKVTTAAKISRSV